MGIVNSNPNMLEATLSLSPPEPHDKMHCFSTYFSLTYAESYLTLPHKWPSGQVLEPDKPDTRTPNSRTGRFVASQSASHNTTPAGLISQDQQETANHLDIQNTLVSFSGAPTWPAQSLTVGLLAKAPVIDSPSLV